MSEPLGTYMAVEEVPQPKAGRTTRMWRVHDRHGGLLGYIEWERGWRQYVLNVNLATFSTGCLQDLIGFIARANTAHAAQRGSPAAPKEGS